VFRWAGVCLGDDQRRERVRCRWRGDHCRAIAVIHKRNGQRNEQKRAAHHQTDDRQHAVTQSALTCLPPMSPEGLLPAASKCDEGQQQKYNPRREANGGDGLKE
jgi:hypothetical protein